MPRHNGGPRLKAREDREGTFYIYWTDPRSGRTRLRSTGTSDRGRAHQEFARWLESGEPNAEPQPWTGSRRASEAMIGDVLAMYAEEHAAGKPSAATVGYNIKALLGWWGDRTCDAITLSTCRAYVKHRVEPVEVRTRTGKIVTRSAGSDTAARELSVLGAAIGYAHKTGKLIERPFVELPDKQSGRERWLTRNEAARLLWESRRDPQARGHLPLFILLALATGARPGALFDLRWTQIDFKQGRINLNPPGRQQTSKRRPLIPLPRRLRWFLVRAHARAASPYVLSFRIGLDEDRNPIYRPLKSVRRAFREAAVRAGLDRMVIPYTLRHTAGTWFAQSGVPLWQIGGWLGHSQQRTTELYGHHHPDYLADARKVMD